LTERYAEKLKVRTSTKVKLKQVVVRIMPRSVKRLAKRVLPRKLKGSFGWQGASVSAVAEALRSRGISSDSSELKTFERLVLEFHQP
jgi:flavorubredoxin